MIKSHKLVKKSNKTVNLGDKKSQTSVKTSLFIYKLVYLFKKLYFWDK